MPQIIAKVQLRIHQPANLPGGIKIPRQPLERSPTGVKPKQLEAKRFERSNDGLQLVGRCSPGPFRP